MVSDLRVQTRCLTPTVECLIEIREVCPEKLIIASGGVRNGLDAMRAYWLGASIVSLAGPFLKRLLTESKTPSAGTLAKFVNEIKHQMRLTLFLTGANNLSTFRQKTALIDDKPL